MSLGYDRRYFLKKAYAIYPGVGRPVSARFLATHYGVVNAERGVTRSALDALFGLAFLAWVPFRAWSVQRKFGLDAAWRRRATRIAWARFADPNDIALFRIEQPGDLDTYIRRFEDAAINKRINPRGWTPECALADKVRFAARAAAANLPIPATVAIARDGKIALAEAPEGRALVAKPADGEGGDGVRMLGPIADAEALRAALQPEISARHTILVQERVETHPLLAGLALNALPTVRVVTIVDPDTVPQVVSATLRFASSPTAIVDNMKAGGLLAAVDLEEGTLGVACYGYGGGDHEAHPVTGAPILRRVVPGWAAVKALAVRAHETAFADYALIGWDIAITPNGPVLIEGNGKPGVLMPQRAARRGLGAGRYGELLAHHLAIKR
jgi:hypothetical protein